LYSKFWSFFISINKGIIRGTTPEIVVYSVEQTLSKRKRKEAIEGKEFIHTLSL